MQLGKLVRFEVKKAVWNKFFIFACLIVLAANTLLWCPSRPGFGNARRVTYYTKEHCKILNELTQEEWQEYEKVMSERYGDEIFSPTYIITQAELMEVPGYLSEDYSDATIIGEYTSLLEQNKKNTAMNEKVLESAKKFGREALKKENAYEIRRNLNIISLYSKPREKIHYIQRSWNEFAFNLHPMPLTLLLVLLSCAGIFSKEKEQQTELILYTTKNGKGKTLAAKYIAAALCAIGITVLIQVNNLVIIAINNGFLGFSQPVTAIEELILCPYAITVGEYVGIATLMKLFGAVLMALLFGVISSYSGNSVISYAVGALVLSGSILLVFFSPRWELLAGPLTFFKNNRYFSSYYTANLFGYPVPWLIIQLVLWTVLAAVLIFMSGLHRGCWKVKRKRNRQRGRENA